MTVFDGAIQIGTTTANGSGAWGFTTSPLPNGSHNFTARATDVAGNTSVASPVLVVTVESVAPPIFSDAADTVTLPSLGGTFDALGGDDKLFYTGGQATIDGGAGRDTVDFSQFGSAVSVNLALNGSEMWTRDSADLNSGLASDRRSIQRRESCRHAIMADVLEGNRQRNLIEGAGGNDKLTGQSWRRHVRVWPGFWPRYHLGLRRPGQ